MILTIILVPGTLHSTPVTPAISAGGHHSLFLKNDGTVWAAGYNYQGQLGDGTTTDRSTPVPVMKGVRAISAGSEHSLFLKTDGTVWAAGNNHYGGLGDGTTTNRSTPVEVMSGVQAVSAGFHHSLFLKADGTAWAAGYNYNGGLGDGTTTDRSTPVLVMDKVQSLSAGHHFSVFLKIDGTVIAAGSGYGGQPVTLSGPIQVQVLTGVKAISAGESHTLFLKTDGSMWAAGLNSYFQLGDGTNRNFQYTPIQVLTGIQAVSAGRSHSLFLKTDDTVWAAGVNFSGQMGITGDLELERTPVPVMSGVQAISASPNHSLFLKTDGTVWATGDNSFFQLGLPAFNGRLPVKVMDMIVPEPTPWQLAQFGDGATNPEIAGWLADPDHDGIANLLEYAGNLPPLQGGNSVLVRDTGTSGLPSVAVASGPRGPVLSIQYLRRKASTNPGITCTPQFSSTLENEDSWTVATGTEAVQSIDADWERVTVTDTVFPILPSRFARVKVSLSE